MQHTSLGQVISTFSTGKALTVASAAKQERTAKREKRIVIELRIGNVEVWLRAS
jgi:hypothetical protein